MQRHIKGVNRREKKGESKKERHLNGSFKDIPGGLKRKNFRRYRRGCRFLADTKDAVNERLSMGGFGYAQGDDELLRIQKMSGEMKESAQPKYGGNRKKLKKILPGTGGLEQTQLPCIRKVHREIPII